MQITTALSNRQDLDTLKLHATLLCKAGKFNKAMHFANLLTDLDSYQAFILKSKIHIGLSQPEEAIKFARKAYAMRKGDQSIYALGLAEMQNKNYDRAKELAVDLKKTGKKKSKAKAHYLIGLVNVMTKNYKEAKIHLLKAKELEPSIKVRSIILAANISKYALIYTILTAVLVGLIIFAPFWLALAGLIIFVSLYGYMLINFFKARKISFGIIGVIVIAIGVLLFIISKFL